MTSRGHDILRNATRWRKRLDDAGVARDATTPYFLATRGRDGFGATPKRLVEFRSTFKRLLVSAIGLVPGSSAIQAYSLHSLRRGGCTHALRQGCDATALMAQGCWKSVSAFALYAKLSRGQRLDVTRRM